MSSVKSSKPPNEYEAFFDIDEKTKKASNQEKEKLFNSYEMKPAASKVDISVTNRNT